MTDDLLPERPLADLIADLRDFSKPPAPDSAVSRGHMKVSDTEARALLTYLDEALDELEETVAQSCTLSDGLTLDSCALSSYASAMRMLATAGRIEILRDVGRRVIAKWPDLTDTPPTP